MPLYQPRRLELPPRSALAASPLAVAPAGTGGAVAALSAPVHVAPTVTATAPAPPETDSATSGSSDGDESPATTSSSSDDEALRGTRPFVGFSVKMRAAPGAIHPVVDTIWRGGPAHAGGIRLGDAVTHLWGAEMRSLQDVQAAFQENAVVGERMVVHIAHVDVAEDDVDVDDKNFQVLLLPILTTDARFCGNRLFFDTARSELLKLQAEEDGDEASD